MPQTYKNSGVDVEAGDNFVDLIAPAAKSTYRPEVLDGVGPFAGLFAANFKKYKNPVLVASTDGVGTKLKIAIELGRYDTIGQDLVAMCVNDIICCGAEPLFFLDYFAMGELKPHEHAPIVEGIAQACKACNCSLIGGETAEMPGMYHGKAFDLAGFAVGAVDRDNIIDGGKIKSGDVILGIASSGIHSNGYSLARKIISDAKLSWSDKVPGTKKTLGELVIEPTKLYPPLILHLMATYDSQLTIRGIAHITGGGLPGNVPRILPKDCTAAIDTKAWKRSDIFKFLQDAGRVSEEEMRNVFNLGIGLVLVTDRKSAGKLMQQIASFGEQSYEIGEIRPRKGSEEFIFT